MITLRRDKLKMSETRFTGELTKVNGDTHVFEYEGKSIEVTLADHVKSYLQKNLNKETFDLGNYYHVKYDDSTNVASFVTQVSEKDLHKGDKVQTNNFSNANKYQDDRTNSIIAQSTLKEAVLIVTSQHHQLQNSDEILNEVKAVHKEMYKYMKNKDYEK